MLLYHIFIYHILKNIRKSYKINKFEISAPTWNDKFELLDELYSVYDIQDYFQYVTREQEIVINNPSIRVFLSIKLRTKLYLNFKQGVILNFLSLEIMELPGSTKDENGENVSHLEITEVVKILQFGVFIY